MCRMDMPAIVLSEQSYDVQRSLATQAEVTDLDTQTSIPRDCGGHVLHRSLLSEDRRNHTFVGGCDHETRLSIREALLNAY